MPKLAIHHLHHDHNRPPDQLSDATRNPPFISKLYSSIAGGLPSADPLPFLCADELELVRGVLLMLQGLSSSQFQWDAELQRFSVKSGVYVPHLSQLVLYGLLDRFVFCADCLKLVEIFVKKVEALREGSPTLRAFSSCISSWLVAFRRDVLKEELKVASLGKEKATSLLGLVDYLSSICAGAECLLHIVQGSVPDSYFDSKSSISAAELAVHILDHLFLKLNEVCLVQGGEEKEYHMLATIFTGALLPYLEELHSWIYDGMLDDPYEEFFFYANKSVVVEQPEFWESSYLLRLGGSNCSHSSVAERLHKQDIQDGNSEKAPAARTSLKVTSDGVILCPVFLKGVAKAIISAGKSLQLVRHVWGDSLSMFSSNTERQLDFSRTLLCSKFANSHSGDYVMGSSIKDADNSASEDWHSTLDDTSDLSANEYKKITYCQRVEVLSLPEIFLISLVGIMGDGTRICEYFPYGFLCPQEILEICAALKDNGDYKNKNNQTCRWFWLDLMIDAVRKQSRYMDIAKLSLNTTVGHEETLDTTNSCTQTFLFNEDSKENEMIPIFNFHPENPVITICKDILEENISSWAKLNISRNFHLPPLNDETLRRALFSEISTDESNNSDQLASSTSPWLEGTDFSLGYKSHDFGEFQSQKDTKSLEALYPFPTLLPSLQENIPLSESIPFQKNGTLATRVLNWLLSNTSNSRTLPSMILQECLIVYIHRQIDFIGSQVMLTLMRDWKLMDELNTLRCIYLLGSADLLQQFLTVIFDKVDKGDSLDDEFELNTILQESIRNSVDGTLIGPSESLSISIMKHDASDAKDVATNVSTPHKVFKHAFGIDALDLVRFTYKVSWPLDLIINKDVIKKYNEVMNFLLKIKRAKFVLDKARRWIWKFRGAMTCSLKHHLLVEQKLLHFVDAFHQYVMDKVLHSSWLEICNGMTSAGSLDEVIDVHEAYLLSIQRQCFVASDKLWTLIAGRIKTILGLALDFYTIQHTLTNGGAAPAIKARCEMEVDRIEKEFDECIAFLLRVMSFKLNVGHFPHLADLVTRINYNYFYMSEDGSLLTIPSFDPSGQKQVRTSFLGKIET